MKKTCLIHRCNEKPYLGGLCEAHAEEKRLEEKRREGALEALHYENIDGVYPSDPKVAKELKRLSKWWREACSSLNSGKPHEILKDETEAAMSWCIALAQELVNAEQANRNGKDFDYTLLNYNLEWVWERFNNLERGLMSNGIERPTK